MAKKKILVVDDEIDFLTVLKFRLESNGYEVLTAFDGEEALKKITKENPDALLLDIMLPGIDGLEILRIMRQENRNLPVFMMTAFSNEKRFDLASKFNASGFFLKTSDLQKEIEKITGILSMFEGEKK
ncbi:MAG TPA: response regulator [Candidatus Omnitrophota bacterium]|nr:response regulator [Candidatus Omnitrophota bacterium]HPD84745.1 response regulator [Candidatus Omnitrophota bacterium]HRZ03603.1 response regulator [Candidatus Omnitrophota bacterium]